jgi:hypothetical protein
VSVATGDREPVVLGVPAVGVPRARVVLAAGALWVILGGFLSGWAAGVGHGAPPGVAATFLLPVAASIVWRTGEDHGQARRRLDVLLVGVGAVVWLFVVLL